MFEKRPNNQQIDFMCLGTNKKMPSGETLRNGDSVKLKYRQYEIEVERITAISEKTYSGTVDSIADIESEKETYELGKPINIRLNQRIEFSEDQIFQCTRRS